MLATGTPRLYLSLTLGDSLEFTVETPVEALAVIKSYFMFWGYFLSFYNAEGLLAFNMF